MLFNLKLAASLLFKTVAYVSCGNKKALVKRRALSKLP